MHDKRQDFEVVVMGESFEEVPPEFTAGHAWLSAAGKIAHWGYAASRAQVRVVDNLGGGVGGGNGTGWLLAHWSWGV